MSDIKNFLWIEKYAPQTIDDIVLTKNMKTYFKSMINSNNIQNLLLVGPTGCGKTLVAKTIVQELEADSKFINSSMERGIDTLRNTISDFVKTKSILSDSPKIIIMDEVDNMSPDALKAMKGFVEEFYDNARFILTCEEVNVYKIPKGIDSRFKTINFNIENKEERTELKIAFFQYLLNILNKEGIVITADDKHKRKILADFLNNSFPGFRKTIIELQGFLAKHKEINENLIFLNQNKKVDEFYNLLRSRNFKKIREWIKNQVGNNNEWLFRQMFDDLDILFADESIPFACIIIGHWQNENCKGDKEINTATMCAELIKPEITYKE